MIPLEAVLERLQGVKRRGRKYVAALCPAHADRNPSLDIKVNDDGTRILLHCFAGCEYLNIVEAMGLESADLSVGGDQRAAANRYLDRIRAEMDCQLWPGRDGATAYRVLEAHIKRARHACRHDGYSASLREIGLLAGISSRKAVSRAEETLEELGWLRASAYGGEGKAAVWSLLLAEIPEHLMGTRIPPIDAMKESRGFNALGGVLVPHPSRDALQDAWRRQGLGPNAYRLFRALEAAPQTASELTRLSGLNRRTVGRRLSAMEAVDLVHRQADGTWSIREADPSFVLRAIGTLGATDRQKERDRLERIGYRQAMIFRRGKDPSGVHLETGEIAQENEPTGSKPAAVAS